MLWQNILPQVLPHFLNDKSSHLKPPLSQQTPAFETPEFTLKAAMAIADFCKSLIEIAASM
jgi:hypothetical protein